MRNRVVLIDATPAVLRLAVDRDPSGAIERVEVTVYEGDGARTAVIDGKGARQAEEALCPPDKGSA